MSDNADYDKYDALELMQQTIAELEAENKLLRGQLEKQKDRQEELDALVKQITLMNFRNIAG